MASNFQSILPQKYLKELRVKSIELSNFQPKMIKLRKKLDGWHTLQNIEFKLLILGPN